MSSRGRGYSRRGGGGSGSNYRSSGGGGYRSQGRSSNTSYSNDRYGNSNGYGGNRSYESSRSNSDRYLSSSGHGRYSDRNDGYNSYKREYGNNRDRSTDRKRSRYDSSQASSRRSHDYGGGSSSYNSYDREKRDHNKSSHRSPAASSSTRFRNDNSSSRRSRERMGPPKSLTQRSGRNGFRGRGTSVRGLRGARIVSLARRNELRSGIRKRYLPILKSRDQARKIKLLKLRRDTIRKRTVRRRSAESKERKDRSKDDKDSIKDDDKKKDGEADEDAEKAEKSGDESSSTKKSPSKSVKKEKDETVEGEEDGAEEDTTEKKEDDDKNKSQKEDDEEDDADESKSKYEERYSSSSFIKLTCIHCNAKCRTFKDYNRHTHYRSHKEALRNVSARQKAQLVRMRLSQRKAQRDLEEKTGDKDKTRAHFCQLCRLNFRQTIDAHRKSEGHLNMKKFLMPFCRVCGLTFRSPMTYEAHRSSLSHIMKKAERGKDSGDEDTDINLENFMTVDSIGDSDGGENDETIDGEEENEENVNVGAEHVKKVEVFWCELCVQYLTRKEEHEVALKRHCSSRFHLKKYLRYCDNQDLKKTAEAAHRRYNQETKDELEKDADESSTKLDESKDANVEETEGEDDKMWADVDKDLGDLLKDVNPENGNADEEDEDSHLNAERYDRFKKSDKGSDAEKETKPDEEEEAEATNEISKPSEDIDSEAVEA